MRYQSVTIYTDNLAFLKTARTILRNHREGKIMFAPEEERDLWTLMMLSLDANSCIYIKNLATFQLPPSEMAGLL